MKSFKPKDALCRVIPKNTHDLFIDTKLFELYRSAAKTVWDISLDKLMLRLGKNVFVFDIDSCEFFEREEE